MGKLNLYRRTPGGPWWADFYDRNGERVRRSTKVRDEKAAQVIAGSWLRDDEMSRAGMMPVARAHLEAPFATHVNDWARSRISKHPEEGSRRYVENSKRLLLRMAEMRGWKTLPDVTHAETEAVLDALAETPTIRGRIPTPKTRHNQRMCLHAFLAWCKKRRRIVDNPCDSAQAGDKIISNPRRAMTREEIHKLLTCQKISIRRRLTYLVMLTTGLRRTPARCLTREMLRLDKDGGDIYIPRLVYVTPGRTRVSLVPKDGLRVIRTDKSNKGLEIPVSAPVARVLIALCDGVHEIDQPILAGQLTAYVFQRDLRLAGIEIKDDRGHALVLHCTRKTANSIMAGEGVSTQTRTAFMSWTDTKLAEITYLDSRNLPIRRAADLLGDAVTAGVPIEDLTAAPQGGVNNPNSDGNAGDRNRTCNTPESVVDCMPFVLDGVPICVPVENAEVALSLLLSGEYVCYARQGQVVCVHVRRECVNGKLAQDRATSASPSGANLSLSPPAGSAQTAALAPCATNPLVVIEDGEVIAAQLDQPSE